MDLSQRVASRWFRARAIPINKTLINKAADGIFHHFVQRLKKMPEDSPIGNRRIGLVPPTQATIKLLDGELVQATIYVEAQLRPKQQRWDIVTHNVVAGGKFQIVQDADTGEIVDRTIYIYLNGSYTPEQVFTKFMGSDKSSLKYNIRRVLLHEWTHLVDPFSSKRGPKKKVDYANSPQEVRARLQEVVAQVLEDARKSAEYMEGFTSIQQLVEGGLEKSTTWEQWKRSFSPASKKQILKAVYQAVADEKPDLIDKYRDDDFWIDDDE